MSWADAAAAGTWQRHLGVYSRTTEAALEQQRAADFFAAQVDGFSGRKAEAEAVAEGQTMVSIYATALWIGLLGVVS